jgi:hypothetical protein
MTNAIAIITILIMLIYSFILIIREDGGYYR